LTLLVRALDICSDGPPSLSRIGHFGGLLPSVPTRPRGSQSTSNNSTSTPKARHAAIRKSFRGPRVPDPDHTGSISGVDRDWTGHSCFLSARRLKRRRVRMVRGRRSRDRGSDVPTQRTIRCGSERDWTCVHLGVAATCAIVPAFGAVALRHKSCNIDRKPPPAPGQHWSRQPVFRLSSIGNTTSVKVRFPQWFTAGSTVVGVRSD
jgi:hypothetical protein